MNGVVIAAGEVPIEPVHEEGFRAAVAVGSLGNGCVEAMEIGHRRGAANYTGPTRPVQALPGRPAAPVVEHGRVICIEVVPNVSEGRDERVIEACAAAVRQAGPCLIDVSSDATHHRSVLTFAGGPDAVRHAVVALFDQAIAAIDLRSHRGGHPRIGAVDVVPFVPLAGVTLEACAALAREVGAAVADRHALPVFLYEAAAHTPARRRLADVRRGGFEALAARLTDPAWRPDFGPARPHPTAGASAIGVRLPLIAFNVNLATRELAVAKAIARRVRERSGGLPAVRAMAVDFPEDGFVQVSMNLVDFEQTSIATAYAAVARHADQAGVAVLESELVGLAPSAALTPAIAAGVRLRGFSEACLLEHRLLECGFAIDGPIGMQPRP